MRSLLQTTLLVAALAIPAAAVDPGLLRLADPEVNLLVGVRMGEIMSSPLMLKVLDESKKSGPGWSGLIDQMGPNPFDGIDELLIMGRIDPGEDADPSEEALIVAHGDFAGTALTDALCANGCSSATVAGVVLQLMEHEGKKGAFAKLSDRYAALGAEDKVRDLIARRAAGGSLDFAAKAQEWARGLSDHHIWIAAQGPFEAPPAESAPPFAGEMLDGLEGVGLGMSIAEDFILSLDLRSKTEQDSQRLFGTLQGLLALATASQAGQQQSGQPSPAALLQQIQMTQDADRITATLRAPADEIQKTFAARMKAGPGEAAASPAGEPQGQPAPPRKREGKIRIYGLEEEPVVVDAGQRP